MGARQAIRDGQSYRRRREFRLSSLRETREGHGKNVSRHVESVPTNSRLLMGQSDPVHERAHCVFVLRRMESSQH